MSWFSRLKNALSPRRLDEDLAEEIADHLRRRAAALQEEGREATEADREAHIRFGNPTRIREETRAVRLFSQLEGTLQDFRYAWRGMRKSPAFALTAILSLGLAIGANTAIYSLIDAAILRPLPVADPGGVFMLSWPLISYIGLNIIQGRDTFSYPEFLRYSAAVGPAARLAFFSSPNEVEAAISNSAAQPETLTGAFVSGEAFDILGVGPAAGRIFSGEEDRVPPLRAVAVISYDYWKRRFNQDPSTVGRTLTIDGRLIEIVGVARRGFFGVEPGRFVDLWLPGSLYEPRALTDSGWHWFRILGRFALGVSPEQVQARIEPGFHEFQLETVRRFSTMPAAVKKGFLQSAIQVHPAAAGVSDFRKTFSRPLWIIFCVAGGILLIACANVAGLLIARSTERAMEMGMRVSLGAGRARLVRQMLTESLLLSLLGGGLGWLAARVTAPLLVRLLSTHDNPVQLALAVNSRALLFCIVVSTLIAVLFGSVPAWRASGVKPLDVLRAHSAQLGKGRLGKLFVGIQVACAFCLVTVGAAFLFSLSNLLAVHPGFDARGVTVLSMTLHSDAKIGDPVEWASTHPDEMNRLRNLMVQVQGRMAAQARVDGAALAWWPIFQGGGWSEQVIIPGKGPSEQEEIFYLVSPGYFATLKTPLLGGRDFLPSDSNVRDPAPVIVNQTFARKYFGGVEVLGRQFSYLLGPGPRPTMIIGVVADANYYNLRKGADPIVYLPIQGSQDFSLYVRSRRSLGEIVRLADREAQALGGQVRTRNVTSMEAIVGATLLRERLLAGVGGVLAFFGLLLAAIGLFGLLSYSVGRRTREIGIRTALGAQRREIVALILKDVAGLLSGGVVAGLAGALAAIAALRSLLFGIRLADPIVTGTAIAVFLLTGLIAAALPARRAATMDPMLALRDQ